MLAAVDDAGYSDPRPIQLATIPAALAGRDILGLAQTGTGKTAAFVLPILQRLAAAKRPGPRALVLCPTRELASQVQGEFERLALRTKLSARALYGGVPIQKQIRALRTPPDVIVACPGRLLDLLGQRSLRLSAVEVLVLDEADHMFDMGFLPDVKRILAALPANRQNLFFSATMPAEVRRLADRLLRDPLVVELSSTKPAETIDHRLVAVAEQDKLPTLRRLIAGADFRSGIVFVRTKRRAQRLAQQLADARVDAVALQGNMSQAQRERAMQGFRAGRFAVLVATDIAARGIDVADVSHVVNFDVPVTPEAYTHRIGRTGRAERSGIALTMVTPADHGQVKAIEKHLGASIPRRGPAAPAQRGAAAADERPPARPRRGEQQRPASKRESAAGFGAGVGAPPPSAGAERHGSREPRRRIGRSSQCVPGGRPYAAAQKSSKGSNSRGFGA